MEAEYKYMPAQQFTREFTYKDREAFAKKYGDKKWEDGKRNINNNARCRISKSAIRVAEVIKAKLDIDLFPLIIPVACKGFDISGGTASFRMTDDEGGEWLFEERASKCKAMRGDYYTRVANGSCWIGRN